MRSEPSAAIVRGADGGLAQGGGRLQQAGFFSGLQVLI